MDCAKLWKNEKDCSSQRMIVDIKKKLKIFEEKQYPCFIRKLNPTRNIKRLRSLLQCLCITYAFANILSYMYIYSKCCTAVKFLTSINYSIYCLLFVTVFGVFGCVKRCLCWHSASWWTRCRSIRCCTAGGCTWTCPRWRTWLLCKCVKETAIVANGIFIINYKALVEKFRFHNWKCLPLLCRRGVNWSFTIIFNEQRSQKELNVC